MGRRPLSLEERRERAIADLRACYPDGTVARLDELHKHLGERLSRLYGELGYPSRAAMIESFGFGAAEGKGGRPPAFDAEELLATLRRCYEGRAKPRTLKELVEQNPDLAGNLKTLGSSARKRFGRPLGAELAARGLVGRGPSAGDSDEGRPPAGDGDDSLAAAARRPRGAGVPRGAATPRGVADAEQVRACIDDMERRLADVPLGDRPGTIAALCRLFPEYEGLVSAGRRSGAVSKELLRERGVLRPPKGALAAERARERAAHVRNRELPELLARYEGLGGPSLVSAGDAGDLLRAGVVGFDVASMIELREARVPFEDVWSVAVGDRLEVEFMPVSHVTPFGDRGSLLVSPGPDPTGEHGVTMRVTAYDEFLSERRHEGATPFGEGAGARVESTFTLAGRPFAVMVYRFAVPLSRETLLYALRGMGVSVR